MFTLESVILIPLFLMLILFCLSMIFFATEWIQFSLYTERAFIMSQYSHSEMNGKKAHKLDGVIEKNYFLYSTQKWTGSSTIRLDFMGQKKIVINEMYQSNQINHYALAWAEFKREWGKDESEK